jgi:hypothetical protein
MQTTSKYYSSFMSKYYLVHANVNEYVWFDNLGDAHDFLHSKWVDNRIAKQVFAPVRER